MAGQEHDREAEAGGNSGAGERAERGSGGCLLVTGLILSAIIAILLVTGWLSGRHGTPNPALSGRPAPARAPR